MGVGRNTQPELIRSKATPVAYTLQSARSAEGRFLVPTELG